MKRLKRITIKILFVLIVLIPFAAFAHYIVFPQQTRSILINFSNFKNDGRIYFNPETPQNKIDSLKTLIQQASARIKNFWEQKTCNPTFIYCDKETDFKKYCSSSTVPAVTYLKLGSYIVLSNDGLDLDIVSHEISHAEFYERIGFYRWTFSVPAWFKHGLAMQNDDREYYSEDTLKVKSNGFRNMPDIRKLKTNAQFYAGPNEQIMLNYMTAKHAVKTWYTKEKLNKLINDFNSGKSFENAFYK